MRTILVLDLDDTLYLERDYVRSGFAAVGVHLESSLGLRGFAEAAWDRFKQGHRGRIFDETLGALGQPATPRLIAELVDVYRHHVPTIALCPDAADFLAGHSLPLALISDGPVASQSAKLTALGLAGRFDLVVLSDQWGVEYRKPHERGYAHVEAHWPTTPPSCFVYVADNPLKDFLTPKSRGWRTVRIAREGGEHRHRAMAGAYAADETIATFASLELERPA